MKGWRWLGNKRGFTLVEVLVASVILLLVLMVAQNLLFEALHSWQRGEARLEARENLRLSADRMSRELRTAQQLIDHAEKESSLKFRDIDGQEVFYFVADRQLVRRVGAEDTLVATGVEELSLAYPGTGRVVITVRGLAGEQIVELRTGVNLRKL